MEATSVRRGDSDPPLPDRPYLPRRVQTIRTSAPAGEAGKGVRVQGLIDRRALLGAMSAAGALMATRGTAQAVLDPGVLNKARSGGGLLDPGAAGVGRIGSAATPDRPADHYDPAYARNMSASVMSALIGILHACGACADKAKSKIGECNRLSDNLGVARRDKWAKLDEYRQGLFCSGCGQTKSEILAKGEQFPHSGQHVIAATPQQIAAKELELDRQIDAITKQLDTANQNYRTADEEASEAIDQLAFGMQLWRLAIGFEQRLIDQEVQDICMPAQRDYRQADEQVRKIKASLPTNASPDQFARVEADLKLWSDLLMASATRGRGAVANGRSRRDAAVAAARRGRDGLTSTGNSVIANTSDPLRANLIQNQVLTIAFERYLECPTSAGSLKFFRMGDFSPARKGEILPSVRTFIERFDQTPGNFNLAYAPPMPTGEAANPELWLAPRRPKPAPPLPVSPPPTPQA